MGLVDRMGRAIAAFAAPPSQAQSERLEVTVPHGHPLQQYYPLWLDEKSGLSAIDDLVEKKGLDIYEEMEERDDMVRASLLLISLGRLSTDWTITPASRTEGIDQEVADFCSHVLRDLDGTSVSRLLGDSMEALKMGFSVSNRVMREIYPTGHKWAGKQGIRTFRPLPQTTITFKTTKTGEIEPNGVWQATPHHVVNSTQPEYFDQLPRDRFVIYTWQRKSGHPLGKSLLRSAWRWYFLKSQLMPWMAGFLETYGWPRVWVEVAEGTGEEERAAVLEALRTFQTQQRMVVTRGTDIHVEELKSTSSMDNYKIGIDLANRGIARSCLQPATLIDQPEVGAYALGAAQKSTFEWVLENIGRTLRDEVMMEQVLRPLVRLNFGDRVDIPTWSFDPFSEGDKVALSTMFKTLVDAGLPIAPRTIYETMGLEAPEEGEEVVTSGPSSSPIPEPPIPGMDDEEDDRGLGDLIDDLASARCEEERVEIFRGKGRKSGSRARDFWQE